MPKFRKLLKNRNFVLYSAGQTFSQFGDRLVNIILIGFVYKKWPGSTFMLAKLFVFTLLPSFFLSPIAGVYVDRWNKKYIMIASDLFRAIAILVVPAFFLYGESIIPIYITIFLIFAAACFFLPARFSIIPNLVPKEDLLLANSASSITWVTSGIIGFSLGGVLAEWIGIKESLYLNSFVYLLSAVSFALLAYSMRKNIFSKQKTSSDDAEKISSKSMFRDIKEGLKTLFSERKIKIVASLFFILSSLLGASYVVFVVFVQETLGSMTKDIGLLSMCLFLGVLMGSYVYGKIGEKLSKEKTISASFFLTGFFIIVFTVGLKATRLFLFGGASILLAGFFIAPLYVTANTIIHETVDKNLRGRIFSSIGIIMNLGFLFFMFLSSILAERVGQMWILIVCGLVFIVLGIKTIKAGFLKDVTLSSS